MKKWRCGICRGINCGVIRCHTCGAIRIRMSNRVRYWNDKGIEIVNGQRRSLYDSIRSVAHVIGG